MRQRGLLSSAAGLGLNAHACWAFDDRREFLQAGLAYLADGRELGQRLVYLAGGDEASLRADLAGLPDRDTLFATGALQLAPLPPAAELAPIDAAARLTAYEARIDEALGAGFTGLRFLADVTRLLSDPALWEAHRRWEATVDRLMVDRPLSALCGYDAEAVPAPILADIACLHPLVHAPEDFAPFRLYADDEGLALDGQVDYFGAEALGRLLDVSTDGADETAVDLDGLEFIDHAGIRALAEREGVRVRNVPPAAARLTRMLEARR